MTCEEFEELSGAFALDAVTPAERLAAEEHLATMRKVCSSVPGNTRRGLSLTTLCPTNSPSTSTTRAHPGGHSRGEP